MRFRRPDAQIKNLGNSDRAQLYFSKGRRVQGASTDTRSRTKIVRRRHGRRASHRRQHDCKMGGGVREIAVSGIGSVLLDEHRSFCFALET